MQLAVFEDPTIKILRFFSPCGMTSGQNQIDQTWSTQQVWERE